MQFIKAPIIKKPQKTTEDILTELVGTIKGGQTKVQEILNYTQEKVDSILQETESVLQDQCDVVDDFIKKTTIENKEELERAKEEVIDTIREIKQGEPGKSVDEKKIIEQVMSKIKVPVIDEQKIADSVLLRLPKTEKIDENKLLSRFLKQIPQKKGDLKIIQERIETDPMSIIERIMELAEQGKLKLKSKHIDGLEQTIHAFNTQLSRGYLHGGGISEVVHDATLTGLGTTASPLSVIGGGGGSTVKVSSADTNAGYLGDKLINGDNTIKLNIEDGGLNERLSVMVDTTVDMNWQTDQTFASTGGILLPMGNTSERPSLTGYFRFNTESDSLEYLNAEMSWQEIATTTSLSGYIPLSGLSTGANLNSQTVSNIGAMTITPASLTGASATSAISLTQTLNTTGNPTVFFMDITNTASGASTLLADWKVGGVSQFNVSKGGILTSRASIVVTAGGIQIASGNSVTFASRSRINSLANGNILLWNQAQTDFGLLQLGGTTNLFPALKRSGTGLISRLADDSADAPFTASNLISTGVVRLKGYTVATLPAGTQGDVAFVTDALSPTFLTAIAGGGAIVTPVFYNGTAWVAH